MTERVSSGPRDGEAGGSGRSNAVKVRPDQAGGAKSTAAKPTAAAKSTAAKSAGAAKSEAPRSATPKAGAKGAEPQLLTKAEKRTLAKQRKARAIAARKRKKALTGALIVLLVAVVIAGGVWLISRSGGGSASAGASASASASAPAANATTPAFPPTPVGADPALATKPTVTAGTGDVTALKVTTLIQGTGAAVKSGQSITVNYVGVTYKDGKEFDASWNNHQAFTTVIGNGSVIAGWDQGLVGVKVGSRVQLDIPQALAYPNPTNGQPAGALRFVVDVLSAS